MPVPVASDTQRPPSHALEQRQAWHALTPEPALDPGLPICDAHHHLWEGGPARRERYLLHDFLREVRQSGHNVVSTVFAECHAMYRKMGPLELKSIGETEFANGIAAMCASGEYGDIRVAAGIVGHVDLRLGKAIEHVLEAHKQASERFCGVRYTTCWDAHADKLLLWQTAPPRLLYDQSFREGLACLQRQSLAFDAWMLFPQLPDLVDLARAMPELRIVLGHIGGLVGIGPYADRGAVLETWKRNIAAVAKCPNVVIKIGGIGILRQGFGWQECDQPPSSEEMARAYEPYCLHCIEQFGPDRCMFESNYPVDGHSASYTVIWNTFKRITGNFSPTERRAMFRDTAVRAYNLDDAR